MPSVPRSRLIFLLRIYGLGVDEFFRRSAGKFEQALREFREATPNPIRMIDVWLRFVSGWAGLVLSIPEFGIQREFDLIARSLGWHTRVIRADRFLWLFVEVQRGFMTQVTTTDESGLAERILTRLAVMTYSVVKRIKFLSALLKIKSESDLIDLFLQNFRSKLGILKIFATFVFVAGSVTKFATLWSALAMAWNLEIIEREMLSQKKPRKYVKKTIQQRVEKRV